MQKFLAIIFLIAAGAQVALCGELTPKDVDECAASVDKIVSNLSPAERGNRAADIQQMRAQLARLKAQVLERVETENKIGKIQASLARAEKDAEFKRGVFQKAADFANAKLLRVHQEADRYEAARADFNRRNREFTIPAEQAAYNAYHQEGIRLAAWKAKVEAAIVDVNEDAKRATNMKAGAEAAVAKANALQSALTGLQAARENQESQVGKIGWGLAHTGDAIATGKPLPADDASSIVGNDEQLKDAPSDKPSRSPLQALNDSSALKQAGQADEQGKDALADGTPEGMAAKTRPPMDTKSDKIPPPITTGTIKTPDASPGTPKVPVQPQPAEIAKANAAVQEYTKKGDELKHKLFDINSHPEKFKSKDEQAQAMKQVTDEQQVVEGERVGALGNLNVLMAAEAASASAAKTDTSKPKENTAPVPSPPSVPQ